MTSPRPRGRPRDDTVDHRVLDAAVEELAEKGIAEFSITSVAARARAAKRSIYARWPRREDLILAGMSTLAAGLVPPHTGSITGDLTVLLDRIAAVFVEPRLSILQRCAAEIADYPDMYAVFKRDSIDRCLAAIEDALHDAVTRGEIRADINPGTVADIITGTIAFRASTHPSDVLPADRREELTALLLDGLSPRAR
ncbi:TetR-like C-terminal domain-containing protein [Nocardia cerradoensis]|uniref:Putative HTH-type transcriptional regulator n=1 Tax=Nocardia cerradoensis TaxID=85688 RepID=A0A231H9R1_9NOCA|nr:TetR-like C-terminal domain-containing protein [Nocardia cerradoensis]NKY42570.1 TetR/AcrR family transcriptional regulator [Nocardia cerradoensis]OXR45589.1 putative HTH-type transcriptional regulator [Nocardia cerradoensis]